MNRVNSALRADPRQLQQGAFVPDPMREIVVFITDQGAKAMDEKEKKPLTISRRVWLNSRHEGGTAFVEVSGQYSEPYFGRGGKTKDNLHEGYTECNVKIADCYRVATLDFTCHDDREFARKIAKVDRLIDTLLRVRKWLVARRFDARRKLAELKKQITKKPLTSRGSDVNSAKS